MGSIFKRKRNGNRRDAVYEIEYFDEFGKRVRERGMTDRRLTEQLLADREDQVRLRTAGLVDPILENLANHRSTPIGVHVEEYEQHLGSGSRTKKHKELTIGRVKAVIEGAKIDSLATLQADRVERYLHLLHGPKCGARTINHYAQAMNGFARWLVKNNRLAANPLLGLERYNAEADVRHKRRALTVDEVQKLIESARTSGKVIQGYGPEERARVYEMAFLTGLRRSELASLTPASFDLEAAQPTLTVAAACSKHRREDVLPLHPRLVEVLPLWLQGLKRTDRLFPRLERKKTWYMVKQDLARVGIEYETEEGIADFHASGRHSYVSALFRSGASVTEARTLARHSDVKMTMRYTHVGLGEQAKALASLPHPASSESSNGSHIGRTPRHRASDDTSRRDIESRDSENSHRDRSRVSDKTSGNGWQNETGDGDSCHHPLKSGGGGNRTHACDCSNDHGAKDLQLAEETLSTLGPRNGVFDCREVAVYASSDSLTAVDYIASAWPHLQPHVREAIMTLIDATAHLSVNDS